MLSLPSAVRVYLCRQPTDMRRSFYGLAQMTQDLIDVDPLSGHLFIFFSRSRDAMTALWWDRTGYCILYKRLERGRFSLWESDREPD